MRAGHLNRLLATVAVAALCCATAIAAAHAQLDVNLNKTADHPSTTARGVSAVVSDPETEMKLEDIHHSEIGKKQHAAAAAAVLKAAKAAKAAAAAATATSDDEDDDMYEYDMYDDEDDDDYYGEEDAAAKPAPAKAAEIPKAKPVQPLQVIVKKNTLRTWDLKPIKDVRARS